MPDFLRLLKVKMSEIYFVIIFTALTFYVHDGFYDILEAKGSMLLSTTFFYVVTVAAADILLFILDGGSIKDLVRSLNILDLALLFFAGASLLATAFSDDKKTAFWGSSGCRMGSLMLVLLCFACIFLSKNMRFRRWLLVVVILSGYIVFIWGIANCFDLDFMGWYENMGSNPYDYLSTIGNRNCYVGYLALLLPFMAALFLYDEDKRMRGLYALYLFLGFTNLYIAKSDGNLLVFGCAVLFVYCGMKDKKCWKRLIGLFWIFLLASLFVKLICLFVDPLHVTGNSVLGVLQARHWYFALAIVIFCLQLAGEKIISMHLEKAWLIFCGIVIVVFAVIAACNFDGSFGTNRGYIWTYTVKTFVESGFWQKVIGWGPDCFKHAVYSMAGSDICATWPENNQIANAHNEILQYLITMGIVGMLSWLAVFAAAFKCAAGSGKMAMAAFAALFAYFLTSLVYNPYPLNYGVLIIMLAAVNMKCSIFKSTS